MITENFTNRLTSPFQLVSSEALIRQQEHQIFQFENREGFANLTEFADSNEHLKSFVPNYQTLIRTNVWPYTDEFLTTHNGLVHRFTQTSLIYVANAITIYQLLKSNNHDDIATAFVIAVFSEAGRGREGKRSKIGLDNQQETLIDELMNTLQSVWTDELGDIEEAANTIVQTVLSGHSSAAELPENFVSYIETCGEELSRNNLEAADAKSGGLAKKILREFCCYSTTKFNKQLSQYRAVYAKLKAKSAMIAAKRTEKVKLTEKIANRIESIGGNTSRFFQLIQQIDQLNFLNDNVDVKYSFKSWPGLIHWNAFDRAIKYTGTTSSITAIAQSLIINQ